MGCVVLARDDLAQTVAPSRPGGADLQEERGRGRPRHAFLGAILLVGVLIAVAGVDEVEVGAGEIPVVGDVLDGFHELEGDQPAATAAGGEGLAGENHDIVVTAMSLMVNAVEPGDSGGVTRPVQTRVLVR